LKKNVGPKNHLSKNILVKKKLVTKTVETKKKIGSKRFWSKKSFRVSKFLCPRKFLFQKNYESRKLWVKKISLQFEGVSGASAKIPSITFPQPSLTEKGAKIVLRG